MSDRGRSTSYFVCTDERHSGKSEMRSKREYVYASRESVDGIDSIDHLTVIRAVARVPARARERLLSGEHR